MAAPLLHNKNTTKKPAVVGGVNEGPLLAHSGPQTYSQDDFSNDRVVLSRDI
jgi:hypothetical protein